MRREDEELCKSEFDAYLRSLGIGDLEWEDGPDPPDYYLTISTIRYAVEVTNLMEKVEIAGREMSHLGFRREVAKFLKGVEEKARQAGILSGAYSLRCKPRDDFKQNRKRVRQRLLDYMKETQSAVDPPAADILGRGHYGWRVKKLTGEASFLVPAISAAKWQADAQVELCELLDKVLAEKTNKLRLIELPKILLILDRYVWLNMSAWEYCRQALKHLENFHTVFGVSEQSESSTLHTEENTWSKA